MRAKSHPAATVYQQPVRPYVESLKARYSLEEQAMQREKFKELIGHKVKIKIKEMILEGILRP